MFQPAIQAFISANTERLGDGEFECLPDWTNSKVYIKSNNLTIPPKLIRFNFQSGADELAVDLSGLGAHPVAPPFTIDAFGNIFLEVTGGNYVGYAQVSASALATTDEWGEASSFDNLPLGVPFAASLCAANVRNASYVVGGSNLLSNVGFWIISGGPMGFVSMTTIAQTSCLVAPGPQGGNFPAAFGLGCPRTPSDDQALVLYGISSAAVPIGTVLPADVDVAWAHIEGQGLVYDETDGNIIVMVSTSDSVTTEGYVIKLRASDAAVLWKVPVGNPAGAQTQHGRIRHGRYALLTSPLGAVTCWVIDTLTGSYTTFTDNLNGLLVGDQCFDDTAGAILLNCNFSETTGSPILLNSSPSAWFDQWAALYVMERYTPPRVPGGKTSYSRIWANYP